MSTPDFITPIGRASRTSPAARSPLFMPVLLLSLAMVGWFGFQGYALSAERIGLLEVLDGQQAQVAEAARVRTALDGLAASTERLAESGNANAQIIVDELRKRGVTIKPGTAAAAAPASAPPKK